MLGSSFILPSKTAPACHAATIAETPGGLVAAFFAGSREGAADVAVWLSRHHGEGWLEPRRVAVGFDRQGAPVPCWNPVLHQVPRGPLQLYYKVGPNCADWWGMLIESLDGGNGWSAPRRLPAGIWGPIRNKPVTLTDGTLLCPSSTEHRGWRVHLEWTRDAGRSWDSSGPLEDDSGLRAIQPTLLRHPAGRLQLLCRTKRNCIAESWSDDAGRTWGTLRATTLPNPNSAIDAVTLRDGRHLLVYNHNKRRRVQWGGPRTPLALALSDDGVEWRAAGVLDQGKGEYSYPAVIQAADGQVHVLYSWRRERIRHVVIDPAALQRGPDVSAVHCGGAVGSDLHLGLSRPPWEEKPP